MTTEEGILFGEFMEFGNVGTNEVIYATVINGVAKGYMKPCDMPFEYDLNWLITAVEKIERISFDLFGNYRDVVINGCSCYIETLENDISIVEDTKKQAIYSAVLMFIKWINEYHK